MLKYDRYKILLLGVIVLLGCIRDVTIDETGTSRELVLNGILDASKDTITVYLSWSQSVQGNRPFESEKQARIRLFERGQLIGEFNWKDSSIYTLPFSVKPGSTYKIEALADGKTIWGETTVPQSLNAVIEAAHPGNAADFLISMNDNPAEKNFYWITATGYEGLEEDRKKNIACLICSNFEYADDFNRYISENGVFKFEYDYYLRFPDNQLSEERFQLLFRPQCVGRPLEVFLFSVDYHLDKYMKSSLLRERMDTYATDMPIIYVPFPVYSNIHGGTGILGSFSSVSKEFLRE